MRNYSKLILGYVVGSTLVGCSWMIDLPEVVDKTAATAGHSGKGGGRSGGGSGGTSGADGGVTGGTTSGKGGSAGSGGAITAGAGIGAGGGSSAGTGFDSSAGSHSAGDVNASGGSGIGGAGLAGAINGSTSGGTSSASANGGAAGAIASSGAAGSGGVGGGAATSGIPGAGGAAGGYGGAAGKSGTSGTAGVAGAATIPCPSAVATYPTTTVCTAPAGTKCTTTGSLQSSVTNEFIGTYDYTCDCMATTTANKMWVCRKGFVPLCPWRTLRDSGVTCDSEASSTCALDIEHYGNTTMVSSMNCQCVAGASGSTWVCVAGGLKPSCPAAVGLEPSNTPCNLSLDSDCTRVFVDSVISMTNNCSCATGSSGSVWFCTS